MERLRAELLARFHVELACLLTVGRTDRGLAPFAPDAVRAWLERHAHDIASWCDTMLETYRRDGDLGELWRPENDWIREFIPVMRVP